MKQTNTQPALAPFPSTTVGILFWELAGWLLPEIRTYRGLITSSRSDSSTSATRTIVLNSMFWT